MKARATDPVQDISFGTALNISLNNYYDLLKTQIGGLAAMEFLQLKLTADPVDINSDDAGKGGYRWWSYWNLLNRSDLSVAPTAVDSQATISAVTLHDTYSDFLDLLIRYVSINNLNQQDQDALADIQTQSDALKSENLKLYQDDWTRWKQFADIRGYSYGDQGQYANWASTNGNAADIAVNNDRLRLLLLKKKVILNKQYTEPDDKKITEASASFDNMLMQIGYPRFPDYQYSDGGQFTVEYLSQRAGGSTSLFDSRRVIAWDLALDKLMQTNAGKFKATFDKKTQKSTSITQDWGASASGTYDFFISASASTSSHTQIQEDFSTAKNLTLAAEAAFRLNITYPDWFQPGLFDCKHVLDNPQDFVTFFGDKGTLLYYPTALILVRGFSVSFESSEDWTYDYDHTFSASAGGGFNAFGVSFGASGSYSEHTHEHQVDTSKTTLTFSDDVNTIRFVGYAVAKNAKFSAYHKDARAHLWKKGEPRERSK